jgi:lysophospholipase L1-like esterase
VLVLGDSNLFLSAARVEAALRGAGFEPTLLGVPGYGLKDMSFWLQHLPALLDADPDVIVVGLGTNDTGIDDDVARFPARLDRMMQAIGEHPVVWITHVDDRPGAPASAGRAINAAIRAAPERWPDLTVLDFTVAMADDPTILSGDDLHFSPAGMLRWGDAIASAAAQRVPSGRG